MSPSRRPHGAFVSFSVSLEQDANGENSGLIVCDVIASEAKQFTSRNSALDCFVAFGSSQ
jgi:hypothetical protein